MKHSSDDPPVVLGGFSIQPPRVSLLEMIMGLDDTNDTYAMRFPDGQYEPLFERAGRLCCIHNGIWYIMRAKR